MAAFVVTLIVLLGIATAIWFTWRCRSRKQLLPCPAAISWLVELENPLARVTRSASILRQLDPGAGDCIADIGCGPGRVTIPLAHAVGPDGEIMAIDVQTEMLTRIGEKAKQQRLSNIHLLLCDARDQHLPDESLDGAVMVMALGEVPEARRLFPVIHAALKEHGRLLIGESMFDPHYVSKEKIVEMAQAAGFIERSHAGNFFAYVTVFEKHTYQTKNLRFPVTRLA
ncbi:MAG: class I SAM-dependent methyltransferase [Burkholderiaceae bacterium]|nr:class I SAM-dependent methyltransferase [Burkholderiaceae bacterium]